MKWKPLLVIVLGVGFVAGGLLIVAATQGRAQEFTPPGADATPSSGTAVASPEACPAASPIPVGSPTSATGATIVMGQPDEFAFDPNELTIAANNDVAITLRNEGRAPHDFHIDELNINVLDREPGESTTVTINAEPGEYEFYCDVGDHRMLGMVGTLIVE